MTFDFRNWMGGAIDTCVFRPLRRLFPRPVREEPLPEQSSEPDETSKVGRMLDLLKKEISEAGLFLLYREEDGAIPPPDRLVQIRPNPAPTLIELSRELCEQFFPLVPGEGTDMAGRTPVPRAYNGEDMVGDDTPIEQLGREWPKSEQQKVRDDFFSALKKLPDLPHGKFESVLPSSLQTNDDFKRPSKNLRRFRRVVGRVLVAEGAEPKSEEISFREFVLMLHRGRMEVGSSSGCVSDYRRLVHVEPIGDRVGRRYTYLTVDASIFLNVGSLDMTKEEVVVVYEDSSGAGRGLSTMRVRCVTAVEGGRTVLLFSSFVRDDPPPPGVFEHKFRTEKRE